jgi:hypothetical protein
VQPYEIDKILTFYATNAKEDTQAVLGFFAVALQLNCRVIALQLRSSVQ